jgi:hypothetical protein
MSSRGTATGFNDTMHITLSGVFSLLMVAMMILSAVAYPGWFRLYALATMVVVVGFGMASALAMRGIEQNDTPWAAGFERIDAYAFAWLVVLAVMVIRHELFVPYRGRAVLLAVAGNRRQLRLVERGRLAVGGQLVAQQPLGFGNRIRAHDRSPVPDQGRRHRIVANRCRPCPT